MASEGNFNENLSKRKSGNFNSEWSHNYLCQLSGGESQCLICKKHIICKAFNIKRHYEQFHKDYDKYVGEERKELFKKLCVSDRTTSKVCY